MARNGPQSWPSLPKGCSLAAKKQAAICSSKPSGTTTRGKSSASGSPATSMPPKICRAQNKRSGRTPGGRQAAMPLTPWASTPSTSTRCASWQSDAETHAGTDSTQNFTMMSEYMTEMGRIKHSSQTGLRPVNQRKIAKAIRRAIGLGLMPSVHRHPLVLKKINPARFL
jgi:ribosomal protein S18